MIYKQTVGGGKNTLPKRFSQVIKQLSLLLVMAVAITINVTSCQDLDFINGRLDKLEVEVVGLKSAVAALQDAYKQGKIIKAVTPLTDIKAGGWLVTFSDDTTIRLENGKEGLDGHDGKDGSTPFLKVDQAGYWTVSYNNGQTFTRLLDDEDNPIKVTGEDGEDGAEGLSIRLVINDAGNYVIQSYYQSDPTMVVNEIATPYTADASRVIASMTQNDKTHVITMTLADGSSFTFNTHKVSPASIAILSVNPIYLSMGTQASVEFRVNPSNALFNLSGDDCQIELDKVGTVQARSSYVTTPSNYKLVRIEQVYDGNTEEIKVGQYRAIIEDTKKSAEYDEMATLVLNVEDANGDKVQISSNAFEVKGQDIENLVHSGLPIIVINTPNSEPIVSKDEYIGGAEITVLNDDMTYAFQGTTYIKGRGNATWTYPKKPYAIKLEEKTSLFGFPQSKKWTLLAEFCDKSLLRTAFMFEISKACSLKYTPNYRHVEVILNGQYNGTYVLTEKVEKDKNRVNVKSDGFIIEHNWYAQSDPLWFTTPITHFEYTFKYPDPDDGIVEGDNNFNYITGFMSDFENTLYSSNYNDAGSGYRRFIDSRSFAKWYILMELLGNVDPNKYYIMEGRGAKLEMYPAWDAEWSLGLGHSENGHWVANQGKPMPYDKAVNKGAYYFARLLQDANFRSDIKSEWNIIKTKIPEALVNLRMIRNSLRKAQVQNFTRWPILGTYQNVETITFDTWDEEADFVFDYFNLRYNWFDTYIESL